MPVSDGPRKAFYVEKAGFALDVDHQPNEQFGSSRGAKSVVLVTSVGLGRGPPRLVPGHAPGGHRHRRGAGQLVGRGVEVSDIRHMSPEGWKPGPHPERDDYESFADFSDPDGNTWILQERKDPAS